MGSIQMNGNIPSREDSIDSLQSIQVNGKMDIDTAIDTKMEVVDLWGSLDKNTCGDRKHDQASNHSLGRRKKGMHSVVSVHNMTGLEEGMGNMNRNQNQNQTQAPAQYVEQQGVSSHNHHARAHSLDVVTMALQQTQRETEKQVGRTDTTQARQVLRDAWIMASPQPKPKSRIGSIQKRPMSSPITSTSTNSAMKRSRPELIMDRVVRLFAVIDAILAPLILIFISVWRMGPTVLFRMLPLVANTLAENVGSALELEAELYERKKEQEREREKEKEKERGNDEISALAKSKLLRDSIHPRYYIYFLRTVGNFVVFVIWRVFEVLSDRDYPRLSILGLGCGIAGFFVWLVISSIFSQDSSFSSSSSPSNSSDAKTQAAGMHSSSQAGNNHVADQCSSEWNVYAMHNVTTARKLVMLRMLNSSFFVPLFEEVQARGLYYYFLLILFNQLSWDQMVCRLQVGVGASSSVLQSQLLCEPIPFDLRAFLLASMLFGSGHLRFGSEWVCGFAFGCMMQSLVLLDDGNLGTAVMAHGVTNFLLGMYVVSREQWHYW
mmetsp:Transcript_10350/g.17757  ORF Transcript_10350/g.17757 Transcript_10350/m.17757 type:complete len:549 (+) Transcript_10350:99-1745(+)|eukprot:CAMPEP_0184708534 /NCGR_PEP_ID=MMETSP0313-20130426/37828_1 /TAXON_ID=2792 /ORGANISM="Porphyridium aerugineum, Strain SAG 1380-2" /LENGTH=548 /DNA_ID=CAMNT_0027170129 /DNA_START=494 /DNA_END=2140 /DNA_ORIENTATION=-